MSQEWNASGADCCSPFESCLLAWCCPCIMYGRVHHRLHKDPTLSSYSCCNLDCCAYTCLMYVGCQWILQMMQRGEVRSKYGLKGDGCTDCLCACCCVPCDLVQQDKEAQFREQGRAAVTQQPGKVEAMSYGAPPAAYPPQHHIPQHHASPPPQGAYYPPGQQPVHPQHQYSQ